MWRDGSCDELYNPVDMPDPATVSLIEEPRIDATIFVPDTYVGDVLKLCHERRGIQKELMFTGQRVMVSYDLPPERGCVRLL